jgi:hypothetical protein
LNALIDAAFDAAVRELSVRSVRKVRLELQPVLQLVRQMPPQELIGLLGEIEEIRCTAKVRIYSSSQAEPAQTDQLLPIEQAARCLGICKDHLYRHSKDYPFTRRMGRRLLFSSLGINQYIAQQGSLTATRRRANLIAL